MSCGSSDWGSYTNYTTHEVVDNGVGNILRRDKDEKLKIQPVQVHPKGQMNLPPSMVAVGRTESQPIPQLIPNSRDSYKYIDQWVTKTTLMEMESDLFELETETCYSISGLTRLTFDDKESEQEEGENIFSANQLRKDLADKNKLFGASYFQNIVASSSKVLKENIEQDVKITQQENKTNGLGSYGVCVENSIQKFNWKDNIIKHSREGWVGITGASDGLGHKPRRGFDFVPNLNPEIEFIQRTSVEIQVKIDERQDEGIQPFNFLKEPGMGGGAGGRGGRGRRRDNWGEFPSHEYEYIPPDLLNGEAKFEEQIQIRSASGINFGAYENIPVEVEGVDVLPAVERFEDLGLKSVLEDSVRKLNYKTPTPVQKYATPALLNQRDVLACAETGSGKTAAFLLPILNHLMNLDLTPTETFPATPEALILTPTRELSSQIGKEAHVYAGDSKVKTAVMYGGTSRFAQRNKILEGINILVTTPGRLREFLGEKFVLLTKVRYFILDEADRMLDMGFMPDIEAIVSMMPPKTNRVNGMFSATFPDVIRRMGQEYLNNHVSISIGVIGGACKDVTQEFVCVDSLTTHHQKFTKLIDILQAMRSDEKVLVFCGKKIETDALAVRLVEREISTTSIHGDRTQRQREEALAEFRSGKRKVLIATAVAARGIDIPFVNLVVNFDLPTSENEHYIQNGGKGKLDKYNGYQTARDRSKASHPLSELDKFDDFWVNKAVDEYVHRIGRSGRVGHPGKALSFFEPSKHKNLAKGLVKVLEDAKQVVPDWMRTFAAGVPRRTSDSGFKLKRV